MCAYGHNIENNLKKSGFVIIPLKHHSHIKRNQRKLTLLNQLKPLYSQDEGNPPGTSKPGSFHKQIEKEIDHEQEKQNDYVKHLISSNPGTYVAKIVRTLQDPIPHKGMPVEMKKAFIRDYFFDHVNFDDVTLRHSNVITSKIMVYFIFIKIVDSVKKSRKRHL